MRSKLKQNCAKLLMLATLCLLPACGALPTNSPPPLIVKSATAGPLPASIKSIDPTPSSDYLQRLEAFSQRLESWRVKVQALLDAETQKSAP